jgi:capsular exopolysaccharide synthesis family protein
MSRNYELLTNLAEERELFGGTEAQTRPSAEPAAAPPFGGTKNEEVVKLARQVFILSASGITPRAVAFCGVEHGDGASWLCAKVAQVVAGQGQAKVCAVDANLSSPALHRYFDIANRGGVAEAVRQPGPIRDFLEPSRHDNLFVLTAGSTSDPDSVIVSRRFRERLAELRREFEYLIFDVPPSAHSTDAVVIGKMLDGVVLVIGAHSTRREAARRAQESLKKEQVHLFGTVLNKRTFPIPESLYRLL